MSRDAQVSLQVRKCLRAKVVRKRVCAKRAQVGRAKRAQMGRAKARAIGIAQKGERWRSRVAPRLGVLVPSASLSFLSLSPLSLSHLASSNSGGSPSTPQSGLAGSPQAHAHCQLGVELHAPRPLVVKPAQHDARTMVVLVVGIRYTGSDHWPIPSATTWSYGPVHRVHDARHQWLLSQHELACVANSPTAELEDVSGRTSHR